MSVEVWLVLAIVVVAAARLLLYVRSRRHVTILSSSAALFCQSDVGAKMFGAPAPEGQVMQITRVVDSTTVEVRMVKR